MIKRSESFLKRAVIVLDHAVVALAFLCAYFLRQSVSLLGHLDLLPAGEILGELRPLDNYLWLLLVILPLWSGMLHMMGAYRKLRNKSYGEIAWALLRACVFGLLFFGSFVFLLKLQYVSRSFMVLFLLLSFGFLWLERSILIACFHFMLGRGYFQRNLLIVGSGPRAARFIKMIQGHKEWGLKIIGLVDDDLTRAVRVVVGEQVVGVRVLGTLAELPKIIQRDVVDEVIFVVPRSWMSRIEPAIRECERFGIRATVAADLFNLRFTKGYASDFDGTPLISFDTARMDEWQRAVKRSMDIVVSAVGLLLFLPLFPLVGLMIKLTSRGPVLFRQIRCGLNGRRFTLYKFRSMIADAERKRADVEQLNELDGPVFKVANDPRLIPVGRWLRKMSVDELPQLINVLKGEMSLVGPRPPIPGEVEKYEPWQRRRLSIRPGITGPWQVNGRNQVKDFSDWMRMDLEYIDKWSLRLDTKILLQTVPAVLSGNGAK